MSGVSADSRYATVPVVRVTEADGIYLLGEEFYASREPIDLPVDDTDTWKRPLPGEEWDVFTARVYPGLGERATMLWWVLCDINDIANPLEPLDTSRLLRCPSPQRIILVLP